MSILEKSIVATVAYYDVLDFPLTAFEIFRYLVNPRSKVRDQKETKRGFPEIQYTLEESGELKNILDRKNGFYFLKGRDELAERRIEMRKINDQKWKKTRRIVKWFAFIPYVRVVFGSGSLAAGNTKHHSDLDLLIITKSGRIWTARFLATILTHVLGVRRHGTKIRDRVCLNHYITEESLAIPFKSLYTAHLYAHMTSILVLNSEKRDYLREFFEANSWLREYLVNFETRPRENLKMISESPFLRFLRRVFESVLDTPLGDAVEHALGTYQRSRIKENPVSVAAGGRITAHDLCLEFHPSSPEAKILEKYNAAMKRLGFPELANEKDSGLR